MDEPLLLGRTHAENAAEARRNGFVAVAEYERLLALIARAVEAADWEPGDAQRALRELRADVAALSRSQEPPR